MEINNKWAEVEEKRERRFKNEYFVLFLNNELDTVVQPNCTWLAARETWGGVMALNYLFIFCWFWKWPEAKQVFTVNKSNLWGSCALHLVAYNSIDHKGSRVLEYMEALVRVSLYTLDPELDSVWAFVSTQHIQEFPTLVELLDYWSC